MSATQIFAYAGTFLCSVAFGMCIPSWLRARRLAKAELAFWESLQRLVDAAREDIERPVSQIASVKRMRQQIADNECRRLRADLDQWGQS